MVKTPNLGDVDRVFLLISQYVLIPSRRQPAAEQPRRLRRALSRPCLRIPPGAARALPMRSAQLAIADAAMRSLTQ